MDVNHSILMMIVLPEMENGLKKNSFFLLKNFLEMRYHEKTMNIIREQYLPLKLYIIDLVTRQFRI